MISSESLTIIKQTVPLVREHGVTITNLFYKNMLTARPELKNLFSLSNQNNGEQQQALAAAVYAYAANINNPAALEPVLSRIAHKHASLGITPSQYTIVGKYLLAAINETLGELSSAEIMAAWDEAYWLLACELISREAHLYHLRGVERGKELRLHRVVNIRQECQGVRSLYLAPADTKAIGDFIPGQYVSLAVTDESSGYRQLRQYSLSDNNNRDYWRITVKHQTPNDEPPTTEGLVSSRVHQLQSGDTVLLSAAYGDFCLKEKANPLVLISAGVGITPMISMLNHLAAAGSQRPILFIHAARSVKLQILGNDIRTAKTQLPHLESYFFYEDGSGNSNDSFTGLMDLSRLKDNILLDNAEYYLCGPLPFMQQQRQYLLSCGVDSEALHYEVFGSDLLLGLD